MANGDYIEVQVNMTAPQYATDEIEDYYGKYISNSAMCSVVRNSNTGDTIALSDRPEKPGGQMRAGSAEGRHRRLCVLMIKTRTASRMRKTFR